MSVANAGDMGLDHMVDALAELIIFYQEWCGRPPTALEARDLFSAAMNVYGELVEHAG